MSRVIGAVGVVVLLGVVAIGVTVTRASRVADDAAPGARTASGAAHTGDARARLTSALTITPAANATAVSPSAPVVVHAGSGTLGGVHLTTADGHAVAGQLVAANEWQATAVLAYGTQYRVAATVLGDSGVQAETTTAFTTVAPAATFDTAVWPHTGLTLGVGQPVSFRFSRSIVGDAARAEMMRHVSVTESIPVEGGWHWFSNREVHFRPRKLWPTGERVTVAWNLAGVPSGAGAWGQGSGDETFAIGSARVSYADLVTHKMTVTENGRTIATFPISGGKPTDPTMNGVHLVLDRESVVEMNSATNGVPVNSPDGYDELVYNDVHISDTGEYVHAAPWSVNSQGRSNVSHGCINLSPANAQSFFQFSRVGDIVIVTGSPRPPVAGDHGVMDWDASWNQFTPAPMPIRDLGRAHVLR
jgi:lipoprotein-anchoring transpeptidase ErfK/SrfK